MFLLNSWQDYLYWSSYYANCCHRVMFTGLSVIFTGHPVMLIGYPVMYTDQWCLLVTLSCLLVTLYCLLNINFHGEIQNQTLMNRMPTRSTNTLGIILEWTENYKRYTSPRKTKVMNVNEWSQWTFLRIKFFFQSNHVKKQSRLLTQKIVQLQVSL